MLRQQTGNIGLHAFFQLGRQRQAPIIEQMIVDVGRAMLGVATVTDQQHLPALFQPLKLAFLKAIFDASGMATAETIGLTVQPRRTVLRAQSGQTVAEEACSQAFEPWHLGQGAKFGRKIGGVLRHADGLQCVRLLRLWCLYLPLSSSEMLSGHWFRR
ncbi:hypothetical protein D3C81_1098770 [compost metagenome]